MVPMLLLVTHETASLLKKSAVPLEDCRFFLFLFFLLAAEDG